MKDRFIAAIVAVPTLYLAWYFMWLGTFATTCTMGDPKSLTSALVFSFLPYLIGTTFLYLGALHPAALLVAVPLVLLMVWQALWGAQLTVVVDIGGRSACTLMMREEFGTAKGGWLEFLYGPYYILTAVGSTGALLRAYLRYENWKRQKIRDSFSIPED